LKARHIVGRLAITRVGMSTSVAATDDLFDDLPLISPEGGIAEDPAQYPQCFVGPLIDGGEPPGDSS
jgi:hypothetical protein